MNGHSQFLSNNKQHQQQNEQTRTVTLILTRVTGFNLGVTGHALTLAGD